MSRSGTSRWWGASSAPQQTCTRIRSAGRSAVARLMASTLRSVIAAYSSGLKSASRYIVVRSGASICRTIPASMIARYSTAMASARASR